MAGVWQGKRVFLTGHTGFKGGWLALWLERLGAQVSGYSLPASKESFYHAVGLSGRCAETLADVRDLPAVRSAMAAADPQVIFHLAAQPIVRASYADPVGTFSTNVMGTAHVLESARDCKNVEAAVVITTDKVYRNEETSRGYSERDALGGHDPYSSSKACAEHVCEAYRLSFFCGDSAPLVATARAGNVIGGGDWASDRLVPDLMRSIRAGTATKIRAPDSVRPWQHVLEPLAGYLLLAERLLAGERRLADSWNFGPWPTDIHRVGEVADLVTELWGSGACWEPVGGLHPAETKQLALDPTKAATELGWGPRFTLEHSVRLTVDWYKAWERDGDLLALTFSQIESYGKIGGMMAAGRTQRAD